MIENDRHLDVLYEDNHLLVVNKPAPLPTMGVSQHTASLLSIARQYIREKYQKPGNVYLGVVSRLDAPVTGVVLLARTSKAAKRLSAAFREREVEKRYRAVIAGIPDPSYGALEHFLRKDQRHRRVHVTHSAAPDAQLARLSYRTLQTHQEYALVEIRLETGRKHQIRVQLAKIGHPVLGDRKYGSPDTFPTGIALHSYQLEIRHPVLKQKMLFTAPLPRVWRKHDRTAPFT